MRAAPGPTPAETRLVAEPRAWAAAAARLRAAPRLALDIEADGFHRYPERLSLVQAALPDGAIYIVDPLALPDLGALGDILADPSVEKVMHSADYDIRSLDRDHGFRIAGLFDTAIAAALCSSRRLGLGNVLEEHLGITLDKPKRLQRLDWSIRPLTAEALDYAAGDVAHLVALADDLKAKLERLGRMGWAAEECRRLEGVRFGPPEPPEEAFLAVRGARKLSGQARAVLRELVVFREAEARRIGRPPHRILSADALIALAVHPTGGLDALPNSRRGLSGGARRRLESALRRGREAPPVAWPRRGENPWTPEARERLSALKRWRTEEAERLDLDPGVVWPATHLERVALEPGVPSADQNAGTPPAVRAWQWQALGEALARFRREVLADPVG